MKITLDLSKWSTRCEHGVCSNGVCKDCFTVDPTGGIQGIDPARVLLIATRETA